jgi:hypothetical protein
MNLKRLKINFKIHLIVSSQLFETLRHSSLVLVHSVEDRQITKYFCSAVCYTL